MPFLSSYSGLMSVASLVEPWALVLGRCSYDLVGLAPSPFVSSPLHFDSFTQRQGRDRVAIVA
jgi:hypothetical protein